MQVKDKVCVVTGGASGIGLALCTRFAGRARTSSCRISLDRFGRIDLFASNAGIAIDGGVEIPIEKWQQIINVNLMSEVSAAKHAIPASTSSS